MSHPPICVSLLEKVPGRKISTQRGHCSSHPVFPLTAIRVQSHLLFGTISISCFFSSNTELKASWKMRMFRRREGCKLNPDLHTTPLLMVISYSVHLLTAACLVVALDPVSVTPKLAQALEFPDPF